MRHSLPSTGLHQNKIIAQRSPWQFSSQAITGPTSGAINEKWYLSLSSINIANVQTVLYGT